MGRRNRLRELNTASDRLEVREQRVRSVRRHAKISGPQPQHHGDRRRWNDDRNSARYWFPCNVAARTRASKAPRRIEASAAVGPAGSSELLFDKPSKTSGMRFAQKAPTALGYYHLCFRENKLGGGCQSDDFSRHMATISVVGPTPTLLTTSITVMANSEFNLTVEGSLKAGDRLFLLQLNES